MTSLCYGTGEARRRWSPLAGLYSPSACPLGPFTVGPLRRVAASAHFPQSSSNNSREANIMRRIYALAGAALALGCTDSPSTTTAPKLSGAVVDGAQTDRQGFGSGHGEKRLVLTMLTGDEEVPPRATPAHGQAHVRLDRKSTRLNSSHGYISYAVFCLKKKKNKNK